MKPLKSASEEAVVPPAQVAALRCAADEYVTRVLGHSLDGSEESLAFVDHYIERVRQSSPPKPEVLRLIAAALGVYLGELCILRFGGSWLALPTESPEDANTEAGAPSVEHWRIDLQAAPLRIDPIAMAAAALSPPEEAEEIGAVFALKAQNRNLAEPLHAALERLAPVDADYFYSLTGRFETLVYVVELTNEIQQQQEQRPGA